MTATLDPAVRTLIGDTVRALRETLRGPNDEATADCELGGVRFVVRVAGDLDVVSVTLCAGGFRERRDYPWSQFVDEPAI
jgi:hypothetical protein